MANVVLCDETSDLVVVLVVEDGILVVYGQTLVLFGSRGRTGNVVAVARARFRTPSVVMLMARASRVITVRSLPENNTSSS